MSRKNKLQEKNRIAVLEKERDELQGELSLLEERMLELQEDVQATDDDIKNRLEQIDRRSEELMSQNEKIKALDDEKLQLEKKLSGEVRDDSNQQLNLLMTELQAVSQEKARPKNSSEAVMGDLVTMAKLMSRMQSRAEMMKGRNDMMGDEEAIMLESEGRKGSSTGGVLNEVRVWYGHTSCLFKVTENHTFKLLLDEVLTYWSLEPSKNVLVNESNFVWPLNASVREVLAGDTGDTKIKVWNREAEAEAKFNWVSNDSKMQEDRKVEELEQAQEKMVADLLNSEEKEAELAVGGFLSQNKESKEAGGKKAMNEGHIPGMDVTRSVETQILGPGESIKIHRSQVDIMRYVRMVVFLGFVVLSSQILFMRRNVLSAFRMHTALSTVFFGAAPVKSPTKQKTVMMGGHYVGDQGMRIIKDQETFLLDYDKMSSLSEFWLWLEGPYRAAVLGLRNGTAVSTADVDVSQGQTSAVGSNETNYILRHNIVVGRARLRQYRSNVRGCVKAEILDVFQAPCISDSKDSNMDKGIETTDDCMSRGREKYECVVTIDDNDQVVYEVVTIDSSGFFNLKDAGGSTLNKVPRYRISNTSWPQMRIASLPSRYHLYNKTKGFTYNSDLQKEYDKQTYYSMALTYFSSYTGAGYTADVSLKQEQFDDEIGTLKRNMWIDSNTRAVEIVTNVYNPSTDYFAVITALVEFPASGSVRASRSIKVVRLQDDWRLTDQARSAMELGLIGLVGFIFLDLAHLWFLEVSLPADEYDLAVRDLYDTDARRRKERRERRMMKTKRNTVEEVTASIPVRLKRAFKVLLTPWRIMDLVIISFFLTQRIIRNGYLTFNSNTLNPGVFDGSEYTDFTQEVIQFKLSINIDCVLVFLATLKVFKYFSYNPNISMVWIVLQRATVTFIHSFYVFFVYLSVFTFAGYIIFGTKDEKFMAYDVAYNQVLSMLAGNFNYGNMAESSPWLAPMYYVAVCTFGYLFLKNVFIAIINDEYYRMAADVRENGYYWIRSEADFLIDEQRKKQEELKKFSARGGNFGGSSAVLLNDNRVG